MKRTFLFIIAGLVISNFANADTVKLNGGMIQYLNAQMPWFWSQDQQARDILNLGVLADKVHTELGMDTIILQNLSYDTVPFFPPRDHQHDLTAELLAKPFMNVYLGLDYSNNVNQRAPQQHSEANILKWLKEQTATDTNLAHAIKSFYKPFAGWYIATEIPNYSPWREDAVNFKHVPQAFNDYIKAVSKTCKDLGPSDVAISLYFNPSQLPPEDYALFLHDVLKDTDVTTLVIQDGYGIYFNNPDYAETVKNYFAAIMKQFPDKKIIADLEIYTSENGANSVADPQRLFEQICNQTEVLSQVQPPPKSFQCIVFDLHHYMNPIMGNEKALQNLGSIAIGDADARKALYKAYQEAYKLPGFPCSTQSSNMLEAGADLDDSSEECF